MTLPALPASGSTDWYAHYSALDNTARAGLLAAVFPVPNGFFIPYNSESGGGNNGPANALQAYPVALGRPVTIASLRCQVGTGQAGSVVRMGLYGHAATGFSPGPLLADGGTVDASTSGEKVLTTSITVSPGLYWMAICVQTSGTPAALFPLRVVRPAFGPFGDTNGDAGYLWNAGGGSAGGTPVGVQASGVNGALPTTFPTTQSFIIQGSMIIGRAAA